MRLSDREERLLHERGYDGDLFREGARAEARYRMAQWGRHKDLMECAEALVENHQDWGPGDIALALARIFNHTVREEEDFGGLYTTYPPPPEPVNASIEDQPPTDYDG